MNPTPHAALSPRMAGPLAAHEPRLAANMEELKFVTRMQESLVAELRQVLALV
jgi:hypothetical protein